NHSKNPPANDAGECEGMGQISMKISALPGSVLSENQHATALLEQAPRTGCLFPNRDGQPYRNAASNYGQVMRRVAAQCAAEGIPFTRFRIHDLRHAFAIRWLKAGGDIYRLSRHLGHTSVKTTEIYLSALTADELDRVLHGGTNWGTDPP
ncbi:tyrosine-type recombinase/integrase, partial [Komagataeibacter swingsii]|uniref:tyrosine-type recombinase/integrase n=1 Tax=Komagataeibacter swingsii TaxID=215220 RepID=UPI00210C90E6